jgi:histidyl-tRNA synthetase
VQARVSDRRVLRTLLLGGGVSDAQLPAAYAAIDKSERDPRDALAARLQGAGLAPPAIEAVFAVAQLRGVAAVDAALARVPDGEAAGESLRECERALRAMGLGDFVQVDLSIVRGLAYYTGNGFELFDGGRFAAAGATTACSRRWAEPICRRWDSAWATSCWASC